MKWRETVSPVWKGRRTTFLSNGPPFSVRINEPIEVHQKENFSQVPFSILPGNSSIRWKRSNFQSWHLCSEDWTFPDYLYMIRTNQTVIREKNKDFDKNIFDRIVTFNFVTRWSLFRTLSQGTVSCVKMNYCDPLTIWCRPSLNFETWTNVLPKHIISHNI